MPFADDGERRLFLKQIIVDYLDRQFGRALTESQLAAMESSIGGSSTSGRCGPSTATFLMTIHCRIPDIPEEDFVP